MKNRKVAESYFFSLMYNFLSILTPLITAPYVARVLEPDGIGIYSLTLNNVNYLVVLGVLGLGTYGQFEIAKVKDSLQDRSKIFFEILFTRLITHSISLIGFIMLIYEVQEYKVMYFIQGVILISSMFDVTWFFQGIEEFKKIALRNTVVKVVNVILIFLFVQNKSDLVIYTIIFVGCNLVGNLCFVPILKNYLCKINYNTLKFRPHINSALIFFVPSVAAMLGSSVDKTMIDLFNKLPEENGYYAQASKIENLFFTMFSSLNLVMRSRMAYLFSNAKSDDIKQLMHKSLRFVVFLSFPIAFGMAGLADNFVPWFFGDGYEKVATLMMIFAGWMIFKPISNCVLEQDIMASGRQKVFNTIIWIGAISNIVLNLILIPLFASIGAAIASVASEFIIFLVTMLKCSENVKLGEILQSSKNNLIAAMLMFMAMLSVSLMIDIPIFITVLQGVLGLIVYIFVLYLLEDQMCKDLLAVVLKRK